MKINVHIGVHKTASTYLQNLCEANRRSINNADIGFMPLIEFRKHITQNLMGFSPSSFKIESHLKQFFISQVPSDVRGLTLSDENLIGWCGGFVTSGNMFQDGPSRLTQLRRLLRGHEVTLFASVRGYDTFIPSAYCEGLRNIQKFVRFDDCLERFDIETLRWPGLIKRFSAALEPDAVKLWRFEDFRENQTRVASGLAFDSDIVELIPERNKRNERPSFSNVAVNVLDALEEGFGSEVSNLMMNSVEENLPKGDQFPGYAPFGRETRLGLIRMYEDDCKSFPPEMWLIPPGG